jgi:hypothetical protein
MMPYAMKAKGRGYVIYNKDTGREFEGTPIPRERALKQLAALHMHADDYAGQATYHQQVPAPNVGTLRSELPKTPPRRIDGGGLNQNDTRPPMTLAPPLTLSDRLKILASPGGTH